MDPGEKRKHARFVTASTVELRVDGRDGLRELWASDISLGGLFVYAFDPPEVGRQVEVEIATPGGTLVLEARVVRVVDVETAERTNTRPGAGLEFTNLSPDRRDALKAYMDGLSFLLWVPS